MLVEFDDGEKIVIIGRLLRKNKPMPRPEISPVNANCAVDGRSNPVAYKVMLYDYYKAQNEEFY